MGLSQFDELVTNLFAVRIGTDVGASFDSITTNDGNDRRIDQILVTTDDPLPITIKVYAGSAFSGTALLGTVIIPALSGSDGIVPTVDLLPSILASLTYVLLDTTSAISVSFPVSASAGKFMWFYSLGGRL